MAEWVGLLCKNTACMSNIRAFILIVWIVVVRPDWLLRIVLPAKAPDKYVWAKVDLPDPGPPKRMNLLVMEVIRAKAALLCSP